MVIVTTIDIVAKQGQEGIFENKVANYLLEGYELLIKTNNYAKLVLKSTWN